MGKPGLLVAGRPLGPSISFRHMKEPSSWSHVVADPARRWLWHGHTHEPARSSYEAGKTRGLRRLMALRPRRGTAIAVLGSVAAVAIVVGTQRVTAANPDPDLGPTVRVGQMSGNESSGSSAPAMPGTRAGDAHDDDAESHDGRP